MVHGENKYYTLTRTRLQKQVNKVIEGMERWGFEKNAKKKKKINKRDISFKEKGITQSG